jgi:hypothetical protein
MKAFSDHPFHLGGARSAGGTPILPRHKAGGATLKENYRFAFIQPGYLCLLPLVTRLLGVGLLLPYPTRRRMGVYRDFGSRRNLFERSSDRRPPSSRKVNFYVVEGSVGRNSVNLGLCMVNINDPS